MDKSDINAYPSHNSNDIEEIMPRKSMSLGKRIFLNVAFFVLCMGVFFVFATDIYKILLKPLETAIASFKMITIPSNENLMVFASPQAYFIVLVKIAFFAAAVVCLPLIFAQLYHYRSQTLLASSPQKMLIIWYIKALGLFLLGLAFGYFMLTPLLVQYFLSMLSAEAVLNFKIALLSAVLIRDEMVLLLGMGIIFQFPLIYPLLASEET